jgi:hypothetical protein
VIPLSRRRPASITGFAILFAAAAVLSLVDGLVRLAEVLPAAQKAYPWVSRDALIVWHSAWLTIALIPVAMVWLSAIRFARWMVSIAALLKLAGLVPGWRYLPRLVMDQPIWAAAWALSLVAVALLFTPASNRWFAHRGEAEESPAVFE